MTSPISKEEIESWPTEPLVNLTKPFVDKRGSIQPLVDLMMKSAVMIESKKGSLRANHYHPQQEQKGLFTKGQIIEVFQDIISHDAPKVSQVVNA